MALLHSVFVAPVQLSVFPVFVSTGERIRLMNGKAVNSNLKNKTLLEINANFTGNANDVVNNIVWCNDASNVPSGVGLLYSFSSYNIGQLFLDFQYNNIYIRYKNGSTNVWTDWTKI